MRHAGWWIACIGWALFAAGCAAPAPAAADEASDPASRLRLREEVITPLLSHDSAKLRFDGDRTVIQVGRKRGIGSAQLIRRDGPWPRRVVVRFEGFTSLTSFEARSIDAKGNVLWRWHGGQPPYTDTGGAIEVLLPQAALHSDAVTLELRWLDAYRG